VLYDKRDTTLAAIQPGDSIIVVSYKDEAKPIPKPQPGVSMEQQVEAFPSPIIADEIHIRPKEKEKKKDDTGTKNLKKEEKKLTWQEIAWIAGKTLGAILVFIMFLPLLYLLYRLMRVAMAKNPNQKADMLYQAALYRFHIAGLERENETPLEYAQTKIDPVLGCGFTEFMRIYLRLKYSNGSLRDSDNEIISSFARHGSSITKKYGWLNTFSNYFNLFRASRFFGKGENGEYGADGNSSAENIGG
jgi:hypothetical protein